VDSVDKWFFPLNDKNFIVDVDVYPSVNELHLFVEEIFVILEGPQLPFSCTHVQAAISPQFPQLLWIAPKMGVIRHLTQCR